MNVLLGFLIAAVPTLALILAVKWGMETIDQMRDPWK